MRSSAAILLASIASAFAYQVTSPGDSEGWTTSGPNYLTWVRVDTDPLNFTAVLTNENQQTVMPQGPQVLNALVDGTLGSIVCNPPSGGWPQGSGYRVNLAADAQHLDTLLAQSAQFNINSTSSSTSSTTKTSTTSFSSGTTSGAATQTTTGASTTSSDTSTTPTSSGAAVLGMKVETGFLTAIAALAAFITTHF